MPVYRLHTAATFLKTPQTCACCGEPANPFLPVCKTQISRGATLKLTKRCWQIPYCDKCLTHVKLSRLALRLGIAIPLLWLGLGVGLAFGQPWSTLAGLGLWLTLLLGTGSGLLVALAYNSLRSSCTALRSAAIYRGWKGHTHDFIFRNQSFATAVADLNQLDLNPMDLNPMDLDPNSLDLRDHSSQHQAPDSGE